MEFANRTPFSAVPFRALDLKNEEFQVVVVKGTYDIVPGQDPVQAARQDPVRTEPQPYGPDPLSSPRYSDDLAPFKPRTDVLVTATSYAPGGRPAREWLAGITLGRVAKWVQITGPRVWIHAPLLGWILGPVVQTVSVPIRYEYAFGGVAQRRRSEEAYPLNPVGRGFVDTSRIDKSRPIPAPTILRPGAPPPRLGKPYPVEGFSPIDPSWQPRLAKAGTFDDEWFKTRHPGLPKDFNFEFYNCAHPELVYPGYVQGGEAVRLERLCRGREHVDFHLPELVVGVSLTDRAGHRIGVVARLDTVDIDTERMKLWLVWRAVLPLSKHGVARIDAAMTESIEAVQRRVAAAQKAG